MRFLRILQHPIKSMFPDRIQFVGHSTLWVTLDNHHFIVDANFSKRLFGIFKRHAPLGIDINNIPDVTSLLVTHAHYDHLDIFTYKYFPQDKTIISPKGLKKFINKFVHNPIVELKPWEEHNCNSVKIIAVPTKHHGFRVSGLRYTKCNGYILKGTNHTVYLPGDTAYGPHFKEIGSQYDIDAACLPIGAYRPRWFMKSRHLSPKEALKAREDLNAKKLIPIHWGSFRLAFDKVDEPIKIFRKEVSETTDEGLTAILNPGESLDLT